MNIYIYMGNYFKLTTASFSFGVSFDKAYERFQYDNSDINLEEVDSIKIQTSSLSFLPMFKHSYIILDTYPGRKVRFDYTIDKGAQMIHDYYEYFFHDILYSGKVIPGVSIKRANKIFKKHSNKAKYSILSHNCNTVARDFYNEITGNDETNLAFELEEFYREEKIKNDGKKSSSLKLMLVSFRKYFCDIIRRSLKQGKTKEEIKEIFNDVRKNRENYRFIDICKRLIVGIENELDNINDIAENIKNDKIDERISDELSKNIYFNGKSKGEKISKIDWNRKWLFVFFAYTAYHTGFVELYKHFTVKKISMNRKWINQDMM